MPAARKPRSISLRQAVDIEVAPVPFVPFQSLRTLDLDRLERSRRAVVELGQFEADCCKRTARAVVKQGYVTEVTLDACADGKVKLTPELARLIARAGRKLKGSTSPRPRLPMPVARFFARNNQGDIDIDLAVVMLCMSLCITDIFGRLICTTCCMTFGSGGRERITCGSIVGPL